MQEVYQLRESRLSDECENSVCPAIGNLAISLFGMSLAMDGLVFPDADVDSG